MRYLPPSALLVLAGLLLAACEHGYSSYPYYSTGPMPLSNPAPPIGYAMPPPPPYAAPPGYGSGNCGTPDSPKPCYR